MNEDDIDKVIDVWDLQLSEPPKIHLKPVSAVYVGWWARSQSVGLKGRLGIGEFLNHLAVREAIAHKDERDEILKLEQMRRRALGLSCDEYSTLCAIAVESGLFKYVPPADPAIEGAEVLEELRIAAGSSSKLKNLVRRLEEVVGRLTKQRASKSAIDFLEKLTAGTATDGDAIEVAAALGLETEAVSRLIQKHNGEKKSNGV